MSKHRRRKPARRNPSSANVTHWLVIGTILAGAGAYWGYTNMKEADKKKLGV